MVTANPEGKVHRLSRPRCDGAADCGGITQQASDIHGALVSILPEHRESLDANLKAELDQLRSRQFSPQRFVSNGHDFDSRSQIASANETVAVTATLTTTEVCLH